MRLLFFWVILLTLSASAQYSKEQIKTELDLLFSEPFFDATLASVDIYNLTDEEPLYQHNNKLLLLPASNMKIFTTAAALHYLGAGYAFETSVYYTGNVSKGTLWGDVYIVGGCDPDFTLSDLNALVYELQKEGIYTIQGNLCADVSMLDSLYWGKGWMWDDDPSTDQPRLTALNINDNMIIVRVSADEDSAGVLDVEIIPETAYVTYHNEAVIDTIDKDKEDWIKFICTRDVIGGLNHIIIKGDLEDDFKRTSRGLNILYPELYFLTLLKERLEKRGGGVEGQLLLRERPDNAVYLSSVQRSFGNVIENLMKESDNLSAEMTLRALGTLAGEEQTGAEQGIIMIDSLISFLGFSPREYRIVDGSGVSRYNVVSTELTLAVLKNMYIENGKNFDIFYNSLPIAGKDGTLERRMRRTGAEGRVHAKTGTLSGVSTLSGYVETFAGDTIAFSIFIQHHVSRTKLARRYQDRMCEILVQIE